MATTYTLEELDDETREYLIEVRDREGRGSPGVFAPVRNPWPAVGCIVGPIVIATTLLGTLLSDIILDDPNGVALLQTAGLLLGGWMFVAAFRVWSRKGSKKVAGNWVYADPLYLYQARGEQVAVTDATDVIEAQFTHNYNNGSYQNSVIRLRLPGNAVVSVTIAHEQRAENMVVYYNYLAWARGPEGGDRANLPPATLGGLAKYVAKHDNEPLDAEGNVDLSRVELDIDEVPEEPQRAGRAIPNVIPYVALLVAGVACFLVMRDVNVSYRDDAAFEAVTKPPEEPRFLRVYLVDERNQRHREQVYGRLAGFYDTPIATITVTNAQTGDPELKRGMVELLKSLKRVDQPLVSIRVREKAPPAGQDAGSAGRAKDLTTGIADKITDVFGRWMPPVPPPAGMTFTVPPPPLGHQLMAFVEAPEDAKAAHLDVTYEFVATDMTKTRFTVRWKVEVYTDVEGNPVATQDQIEPKVYTTDTVGTVTNDLKESIVKALLGSGQ